MKLCQVCGQLVAEEVMTCPSCGSEAVQGRKYIDDYEIVEILHEGYSSILCRAVKNGTDLPVMIRIFTAQSGVDEKIAFRLTRELEELKKLPEDYFVRHIEIRRASDGLWYRVSEWIDAENWGTLLASGQLKDPQVIFSLFYRIASILDGLHRIGHYIPHLILDDIIVFKGQRGDFEIKIDYKLSRFLDPQMDRPGPMLKRLLSCHPDIMNDRPLDFRSDIWSLGKIFLELLSADFELCDFISKTDEMSIPNDAKILLKIMLAEDPDLRPRSMTEVAEILRKVNEKPIKVPVGAGSTRSEGWALDLSGIKKRIGFIAIIVAAILILGIVAWFYVTVYRSDSKTLFEDYASRYAKSVAFVMVQYGLKVDDTIIYQNRIEGTAFLVDKDGYLLTNRHVACPWLEDARLYAITTRLKQMERSLHLEYQAFIWFEGEKAFNRLPGLSATRYIEDIYNLDSSHRTDGVPSLAIAGVAISPFKTRQILKSPLRDDFAVLKIDRVPGKLIPLPLAHQMDPLKLRRLSPVITLGFPLGSQTQEATVNVSVTRGYIRRTFSNLFQVDTSIYRGNSGGPIIDINGEVIGIVARVAVEMAVGPLPVATRLSDIGMILPIKKASTFLRELKAGQVKWNGVLDLTMDAKIKEIMALARHKKWREAEVLANTVLDSSLDPGLIMASGIVRFCSQNFSGAHHLFSQALSIDAQNLTAKFMLFLIDWHRDKFHENPYRSELLSLDWRSPFELFGYLAWFLEEHIDQETALKGWYSTDEKSWLYYIAGLIKAKHGDWVDAEQLLREALLTADNESWPYFLALSKLDLVQQECLAAIQLEDQKTSYRDSVNSFALKLKKTHDQKSDQTAEIASLLNQFNQDSVEPMVKRGILEKIHSIEKANGDILMMLAYYYAMDEAWQPALDYAWQFLEIDGRESAGRLSIGLLVPEILYYTGKKEAAIAALKAYTQKTKAPWYQNIAKCILGQMSESNLVEMAGKYPEYLLTAHTALGFWAEGSGRKKKALNHYKEALASYLDDTLEYEFAMARMEKIKRAAE